MSSPLLARMPKISRFGNVALYLWEENGIALAVGREGRPARLPEGLSREEVEAALALWHH